MGFWGVGWLTSHIEKLKVLRDTTKDEKTKAELDKIIKEAE